MSEDGPLQDMSQDLLRTGALLRDVQDHLDQLAAQRGARVSGLCLASDQLSSAVHSDIASAVHQAQHVLLRHNAMSQLDTLISIEHVQLLTQRQADAVQIYLQRLQATSRASTASAHDKAHYDEGISLTPMEGHSPTTSQPSSPTGVQATLNSVARNSPSVPVHDVNPIIAHAYVRYMGDLSGGQHMVKRLCKMFPVHLDEEEQTEKASQTGFAFYTFDQPAALKDRLRSAIDGIGIDESGTAHIVSEATQVFDLHHALFESLVQSDSLGEEETDDVLLPPLPGSFPFIVPSAATAASV